MGRSKGRGKGGGAKAAQAASGTESTKKWSVEEDKMFLKRSKELIKEGNKHFQQAKLEHARQSYEKALQLCKGHRKESAQLHSNLGAILLLQHKFDEAIQECTLSLELDQYNVTTRRRRAQWWFAKPKKILSVSDKERYPNCIQHSIKDAKGGGQRGEFIDYLHQWGRRKSERGNFP